MMNHTSGLLPSTKYLFTALFVLVFTIVYTAMQNTIQSLVDDSITEHCHVVGFISLLTGLIAINRCIKLYQLYHRDEVNIPLLDQPDT